MGSAARYKEVQAKWRPMFLGRKNGGIAPDREHYENNVGLHCKLDRELLRKGPVNFSRRLYLQKDDGLHQEHMESGVTCKESTDEDR